MGIQFNDLYQNYYQRVYHVALKITKDSSAAEDVLQETFLKAYNKLNEVRDVQKAGAWLSRIASNKAIDYLRREKKVVLVPENEIQLKEIGCDYSSSVEREMEQILLVDDVTEKVSTLPPKLRVVLLLNYQEQLGEKEIARQLNITPSAVKSRLHRARKAMKEKMNNQEMKVFIA
ncbi:RNA polymerase sigma factor [Halobacillus yeomjeoni]|uniref:RNA polymerase sigma factor n=1 Tax=Halobacillus yeomjeoni TaxID=311194 RepID=A0A931HYE3_9BACI|nr:RNA polymerase sigma factor [Halobacillus yeomjeoni]MBH0231683.1 RNA polymerase sigma factor [Halobacillus yeomjeoni]